MTPDVEERLCRAFPKIFAERLDPRTRTPMERGIECGDGWYNIIDRLCQAIQWHLDHGTGIPQVVATQVKEKLGTLCFYYRDGDEFIRGLVSMAREISAVTCDVCGAPGVLQGASRIMCRCQLHGQREALLKR